MTEQEIMTDRFEKQKRGEPPVTIIIVRNGIAHEQIVTQAQNKEK